MAQLSPRRYPLQTIDTSLYTTGNEFVYWEDYETEYIGLYHKLPNGNYWTGAVPNDRSYKLLKVISDESNLVKSYKQASGNLISKYESPRHIVPKVSASDYRIGHIFRYFVQKRNSPINTIHEVHPDQYLRINNRNIKGINRLVWNYHSIEWKLLGDISAKINARAISKSKFHFTGLDTYLTDPYQFILK